MGFWVQMGQSRAGRGGGYPGCARRPHSSRPHVCMCIYVSVTFFLSLFCVFVEGPQKCFRPAGEGDGLPRARGTRVTAPEALT